MADLESIVVALAKCEPIDRSNYSCAVCGAAGVSRAGLLAHDPGCPWRRAQVYVDSLDVADPAAEPAVPVTVFEYVDRWLKEFGVLPYRWGGPSNQPRSE